MQRLEIFQGNKDEKLVDYGHQIAFDNRKKRGKLNIKRISP